MTSHFTLDELTRLTWLRAVEWLRWPSFIAQPILPVAFLFTIWYMPIVSLIVLNLLWLPIRYKVANIGLAKQGCVFVRLKWVTIPAAALYAGYHREWLPVILALFTPAIVVLCGFFMVGQVGVMQRIFLQQLGIWSEDEVMEASQGKGGSA